MIKKKVKIKENKKEYILETSATNQVFSSGALRSNSENKGSFSLISPLALSRLAKVLERGKKHYGPRNWEKGLDLDEYMESAIRHLCQYLEGERNEGFEDHLGQCAFNIMACIHTEEMIKRGLLPKELDNLPNYIKKDKK